MLGCLPIRYRTPKSTHAVITGPQQIRREKKTAYYAPGTDRRRRNRAHAYIRGQFAWNTSRGQSVSYLHRAYIGLFRSAAALDPEP